MDERLTVPSIEIRGATEHNLKDIDVDIPRQAITVISGVSGAGKSTLVFEIIFKEAQRRYLNTMSLYTRKLLQEFSTPKVKSIHGLSPALSLASEEADRTTIGELTGVDELWRILLVAIGQRNCPQHALPTTGNSPTTIVDNLLNNYYGRTVIIAAPLTDDSVAVDKLRAKYLRIINGATLYHLDELESLPAGKTSVVIDVIKVRTRTRLLRAIEQCLALGNGCGQLLPDKKDLTVVNYFSSVASCPVCGFNWPELNTHSPLIDQYPQAITIVGKSLTDIRNMPIDILFNLATSIDVPIHLQKVIQTIRSMLLRLQEVNLDYLTLSRTLASLATGERQKIRIVSLIKEDLNGVIYLFDEPSQGLATEEIGCLWQLFTTLKKQGNTVIIVDHQRLFFDKADQIIELGPAAGINGGQVLAKFSAATCAKYKDKSPVALLVADNFSKLEKINGATNGGLFSVIKATANNLRLPLVNFTRQAINVVSGVSGAGKSTLVKHCLYQSLRDGSPHGCQAVDGLDNIEKVSFVGRSSSPSKGTSMVITQLGIFSWLRQLFGQLRDSQLRGFRANDFGLQSGKGRCQYCQGRGTTKTLPYLPATLCAVCGGHRYNNAIAQVSYRQRSISSVLALSIAEAEKFFANFKKIAQLLAAARTLGLGYLALGRRTYQLSAGEWQRLKLVPVIAKATNNSLIILDEPAAGLHHADIVPLMQVLNKLTATGTTVVIVEHNPLVIANSAWQIELGPGGGPHGGRLLHCGKPNC